MLRCAKFGTTDVPTLHGPGSGFFPCQSFPPVTRQTSCGPTFPKLHQLLPLANRHRTRIHPAGGTHKPNRVLLCPAVHHRPDRRRSSILSTAISDVLPVHLVLHLHGNERRRSRPASPPLSITLVSGVCLLILFIGGGLHLGLHRDVHKDVQREVHRDVHHGHCYDLVFLRCLCLSLRHFSRCFTQPVPYLVQNKGAMESVNSGNPSPVSIPAALNASISAPRGPSQ